MFTIAPKLIRIRKLLLQLLKQHKHLTLDPEQVRNSWRMISVHKCFRSLLIISLALAEIPTVRAIKDRFSKLKKMANDTSQRQNGPQVRQITCDQGGRLNNIDTETTQADNIKTPNRNPTTDGLLTPLPTQKRTSKKRKRTDLVQSRSEDTDFDSEADALTTIQSPTKLPRRDRMTLRHVPPKDYSEMIDHYDEPSRRADIRRLRCTDSDQSDTDFDLEEDLKKHNSSRGIKRNWRHLVDGVPGCETYGGEAGT